MTTHNNALLKRAKALKLHCLVNYWSECAQACWVESLVDWEDLARTGRSPTTILRFKPPQLPQDSMTNYLLELNLIL